VRELNVGKSATVRIGRGEPAEFGPGRLAA